MSKILVTGAAGFIGSRVAGALASGHEVIAAVRPGDGAARLRSCRGRIRIEPIELEDRRALGALLERERPDCLLHAAWYAGAGDYLSSRRNLASLSMTLGVFEEALAAGCARVVGVGTCLEYAAKDAPRLESDPCAPESLYAACKLAAATVGKALALAAGAEFAWARVFHVHGPDENMGRLLPAVVEALRAGRPFELTLGEQVRDHLHVADVGAAIALLAAPGVVGPLNICSGDPVRLREVLLTVGEILGRPDLLRFGSKPERAGEMKSLVGDASALRRLGFSPRFASLRDGLRDAVEGIGR